MGKYLVSRLASSGSVASGAEISVWGISLEAGSDAATVTLKDLDSSGSPTGDDVLGVKAVATDFRELNLADYGGRWFANGAYATISGTSPVVRIWYE
jgi:hypothetical protein